MITIISHFYKLIQLLLLIIFKLLKIIEQKKKYPPIPDDSKSYKYQKFKLDKTPTIIRPQVVDYLLLIEYYKLKYLKTIKPIKRKDPSSEPDSHIKCPYCKEYS